MAACTYTIQDQVNTVLKSRFNKTEMSNSAECPTRINKKHVINFVEFNVFFLFVLTT